MLFHKARTVARAVTALQETVDTVPEDSTEYFPSLRECEQEINQAYAGTPNLRSIVKTGHGHDSAKLCGAYVLGFVSENFQRAGYRDMAKWWNVASHNLMDKV